MANKLPDFGTNASPDKTVVDGTATVVDSGFQVNTVIAASEVNTYFKSLMTGLKGLIDTIDMSTLTWQASDTSATWKSNFSAALKNYVVNTQVTEATKLSSNAGDATHPIYFSNGKPAKCNDTIASNISGNAATATKLADARTISISGDAEGRTGFSGASDSNISLTVNKAAKLSTGTTGSSTNPIYFNDGKPVATTIERIIYSSLVKSSTGNYYYSKISDTSKFLAYIIITSSSGEKVASGIIIYNNGYPMTSLQSYYILNQKASTGTTTAGIATYIYGDSYNQQTKIMLQAIYGDGHTDSSASVSEIQIYKLFNVK